MVKMVYSEAKEPVLALLARIDAAPMSIAEEYSLRFKI
jgi:hypothetical protein